VPRKAIGNSDLSTKYEHSASQELYS